MQGEKREFTPLEGNQVRMYTCGPTVYDFAHIGNFRAYVFEDLLRRWLKFRGYDVYQVMNITDVDDKTMRGASEAGLSLPEYTQRYTEAFFEDLDVIKIERAEVYPRATEHIPEMLELITKLEKRNHTYVADGSVYFSIKTFSEYGRLSKMKLDEMKAGARVDVDEYDKADARDFVLWKAAKPGEPSWDSPYGAGRPGWHIECSAMSMKYLGESFDIHTGAVDNIFPHHENEIAQSVCATGKPFVNFWLHCEWLLVNGEKMSKSKGNFYTLRDLLAKGYDPLAIRLFLMSSHYRQSLNFTSDSLEQATAALTRIHDFWRRLEREKGASQDSPEVNEWLREARAAFVEAGDDDLNIPKALGHLFDFIKFANGALDAGVVSPKQLEEMRSFIADANQVLGLIPDEEETIDEEITQLVAKRDEARLRKDFATADSIRKKLNEMGFILEDAAEGTEVKKASHTGSLDQTGKT